MLLRAWECFWGCLGGLWLQNSFNAQNRIIRSNLKNTVKYVINSIRRIIRLRRMTHPWKNSLIRLNLHRPCCLDRGHYYPANLYDVPAVACCY